MIHIKGDRTQPCLTPDLIQKQLLTSFPTLTTTVLFAYIAQITLMYFSGIPYNGKTFVRSYLPVIPYKDKTYADAVLSTESTAC